MSETDTAPEEKIEKPKQAAADDAGKGAARGARVLAALIGLSLLWYLMADRYAPYTTQARVQGYVIGVAPQVAGNLTQVWVSNNQDVAEGEKLFEIDPTNYRIALTKARSDLENARRQVEAGSAAVESARASLRAAEANELRASQDYERLKRLRTNDPGTISERRLESAQATLDQARAQVSAAESTIEQAIEQMGGEDLETNAILLAARSAVEKAEFDQANTTVLAPSRGVITDMRADVGNYAGTGQPVMTLIAIHDLWVDADFTENNLGHIERGSEAEILFDAVPGEVFTASVRSVGLGVSAGNEAPPGSLPSISNNRDWLRQAQRFPVQLSFSVDSSPELRQQVRLGGQASVIVYAENSTVLRWLGKLYIRVMSYLSYAY